MGVYNNIICYVHGNENKIEAVERKDENRLI